MRASARHHSRLGGIVTRASWDSNPMLLGLLALIVMLAANELVFGGAGYIVLLAPIGWILFGGYRYRILSTRLRRRKDDDFT